MGKRLLIGTPARNLGDISPEWVANLRQLDLAGYSEASLYIACNTHVNEIAVDDITKWRYVATNMEKLRLLCASQGFDDLFIVDSDIYPRPDALRIMSSYADKYDIIVGVYNSRKERYGVVRPQIAFEWNNNRNAEEYIRRGEPFEVEGFFPTGLMLVTGRALIVPFINKYLDEGVQVEWFGFKTNTYSADMAYSRAAHEYGMRIICVPAYAEHGENVFKYGYM